MAAEAGDTPSSAAFLAALPAAAAAAQHFNITGTVHLALPLPGDADDAAETGVAAAKAVLAAAAPAAVVVGPLPGTPAGVHHALLWLDAGATHAIVAAPPPVDGSVTGESDVAAMVALLGPVVDARASAAHRVHAAVTVPSYSPAVVAATAAWATGVATAASAGLVLLVDDPAWLGLTSADVRALTAARPCCLRLLPSGPCLAATTPAAVAALHVLGVTVHAPCTLTSSGAGAGAAPSSSVPGGGAALPLEGAFVACLRSDRVDGLFTTVVTDERGLALGLVYSSADSVQEALRCRRGVYFSRSRCGWLLRVTNTRSPSLSTLTPMVCALSLCVCMLRCACACVGGGRCRGGLWRKGDTSGAHQTLVLATVDCDSDALLFKVVQVRPRGTRVHPC